MTGRTSSLHGRTQNPIAFRVDIDLPKIAYAAYSLPELVEKAPQNNRKCINSMPASHNRGILRQLWQDLLHAFPIGLNQPPQLPPSQVSQRGPHAAQAEKSRNGPHRKT